jgi:hypothetical protein
LSRYTRIVLTTMTILERIPGTLGLGFARLWCFSGFFKADHVSSVEMVLIMIRYA